MFKIVTSKSSYRWSNIWSEQTNTKDLKIQCCYKKEISYEAVSSSKFDTHDVQIDIFPNFWLNFTKFHISFQNFKGSSTKKEYLQMILLKSKEKMMGIICGGDQF